MIPVKHLCCQKSFFVHCFIAALIVASVLLPFKNEAQPIHSISLATPVTLDGYPNEWPQPFRYYDGSTKLQFAIANDTANIYICLKITDEPTQKRLFTAGLGIWIDPKGKKKETEGIMFPQKVERNPGEAPESRTSQQIEEVDPAMQKSETLRLKRRAYFEQITLRIKGFAGTPDQVLPLKNGYGIDAAFAWDSLDILSIEYKIPIKMVFGHGLAAMDTLKPIGLGFLEPPMEAAGHKKEEGNDDSGLPKGGDVTNSSMNNGGMGGMNRGGMGGGGMGGGRGGGHGSGMQMGDTNPLTQEQKVWSKVILILK